MMTNANLASEVAGMIGDTIGDRLIGGEDFEPEMPLATDVVYAGNNVTIIDFEDGRKATIVVTISS